MSVADTDSEVLSSECHEKLVARRAMFSFASRISAPQTLIDLKDVVTGSPVKSMFVFIVTCSAAVVFVGGLVFGRATRHMRYMKNK
ncbi:unnamed protein product [Notodromas monacha]|uniref:Transmembrane protein n=1 Tax=Notodromas monacha TaxID=399045 RepID=A0A7R9BVA0_9CRUS|nr:unnamed protein product [Notodromas monacha]CAG0922406.1 unnamed protein product [Notodromas monacha]